MIKAIILDFDGVVVESQDIKTKAFRLLFENYPEKLQSIVAYHKQNMGISRYVKFRHIYKNMLKQNLSNKKEIELGKRFSQIVVEEVLNAPFVSGAIRFLNNNIAKYLFFIVSGTPEKELRGIVRKRRIGKFFKEIFGSPKQKANAIKDILRRYQFNKEEVVFIGDAGSDKNAAKEVGVNFIARINSENNRQFQKYKCKIRNLVQLSGVIKNINKETKKRRRI